MLSSHNQELEKYVKAYEAEDELDNSKGFNILEYGKKREKLYPRLSGLAKLYLKIPATTISVESLFSTAGQIITERRTRLSRELASDLILLEEYYHFQK